MLVPPLRRALSVGAVALMLGVAATSVLCTVLLGAVHVDDRYGVTAASGVWMGLAAAARHGVWYPPVYGHGFYGGTRYTPLPVLFEGGASLVSDEYLVSAKLMIYLVCICLYALVYVVARRRGAPVPVAVAIVGAVLASSAASTTTLGIRWDAFATLAQLAALALVADVTTPRRAAMSGALCSLALATKISALWAPAALLVWLARRSARSAVWFGGSLLLASASLAALFGLLSHGRLFHNLQTFAFAGSQFSSRFEGLHRLYQIGLRNERSLPLLLALAAAGTLLALVRRTLSPYEISLIVLVPILIVVMRDVGAYENHLLDLDVLGGIVVAGMWRTGRSRRLADALRLVIAGGLILATGLALRYTAIPDVRRAWTHELRGRADPAYSTHPLGRRPDGRGCALFEDASIPILAGERPVVLDAFIVHRLQRDDPRSLELLVHRVERHEFSRIVLGVPLTDRGWFATLDFGTRLWRAMRAHYRLNELVPAGSLLVYTPGGPPRAAAACRPAALDDWH